MQNNSRKWNLQTKNLKVLVINALRKNSMRPISIWRRHWFYSLGSARKAYLTHVSHMLVFMKKSKKACLKNVYPYDNLNHIIIKLKMKKSLLLYAFIIYYLWTSLRICFIAKKLHSNKVDKKVTKKLKIILLYLQLNLMMPTIFFGEKRKCAKLFWVWKFGKTIQYENWFPMLRRNY
jgi:hypothetical protein